MSEIQKWADEAMFKAEPLKASDGPKVFLLAATPDPLGAVAAMSKMYKGEVVRNMGDVTDEERRDYLRQILKTKLKAPLEAVKVHFMVEGVTRSFTHQMVRQRTAVYAQESLRFAVKEDMAEGVALPPSLSGTVPAEEWSESMSGNAGWDDKQYMRDIWDDAIDHISQVYNKLVNMGMPAEDARGLLPHNITTRLNYVTDLRALQDHAGNRLCTQAQFEWRLVWVKIIDAMRGYCSDAEHQKARRIGQGEQVDASHASSRCCDNWQWQEMANIFRPVCYLTGKCEFKADFDRACSIRDRVEANHSIGRPSSEWDKVYHDNDRDPDPFSDTDRDVLSDTGGRPYFIGSIHPASWLLDPAAAR